jgi:LPS-assembly protein
MRFKPAIAILIFFLSAFIFPFAVTAGDVLQSGGVTLYADALSHDQASDTYRATGNVMIVWQESILIADSAYLRETDNEAFAEGKVRLVKGGDVLKCDRIQINLITQEGEITNGDLFSRKANFHLRGQKIVKLGEDEYRVDHGTFTTCDGDHPSWKFVVKNLDVHLEGNAVGYNTLFYIKDVPSFYTPYIIFPAHSERQSGFLFPDIGNSNIKGFNVKLPYYWAISPSQDATIDLDMQTKRGVGLGFDYNYRLLNDSLGKITGYFIYDENQDKERGHLETQQQEWFSPSFVFKSDLDLISDRTYLQDYSVTNGVYNAQILDSSISLTKNWQNYSLAGEFRYADDLIAPNNTTTLEKLPEISFTAIRQKMPGIPLYLALDSTFANFYRDSDIRGQRIDLHPYATTYLAMPAGLEFSAWGGYHERMYNAYSAGEGESGNGSREIGIADGGATIATSLSRVYDTDWGSLKKLKHTIVPEVGYSLVEEKNQDSLPFFDYNDRELGHGTTTWAVTNYLSGRFQQGDAPPAYRDLLYLRLSEGYQLSGLARDPLTGTPRDLLALVDQDRKLTDIRVEANITPTKELSIFTDNYYYPYSSRFDQVSGGFDLKSDKENMVGLSYFYARDLVKYMEGRLGINLLKPFVFNFMGRYSFDGRNFLETKYSLEYRQQCWSIIFSYQDRPILNDHSFMISFDLAGIGKIKAH